MNRRCGNCAVCCNLLEVRQLEKPNRTRCEHLCPSDKGCCSIFEDAPAICHKFECIWRSGELLDEERPDKIGLFLQSGTLWDAPLLIGHPITDDVYTQEATNSMLKRLLMEGRRLLLMTVSGDRKLLPPVDVKCTMKDGSEISLPLEIAVHVEE